jgi:thiol-disulfide isomerase/thioredoxin
MKKYLASLLLTVFLGTYVNAQRIRVGEKLPGFVLDELLTNNSTGVSSADLKNKAVILEFWSTGCHASIKSLSIIDSFQEKYKAKLQFIAINSFSKDSVTNFFANHRSVKIPQVPMISADTVLASYFPHNTYPWQIWIDADRTVKYITSLSNLTEKNIAGFIKGEDLPIISFDFIEDFDYNKPLISEKNGRWLDTIPYYSFISHCLLDADVPTANLLHYETTKSYRISLGCNSVTELLIHAFSEHGKYDFSYGNAVALEVRDVSKFLRPSDHTDRWMIDNAYSYDIKVPEFNRERIYDMMKHDLVNYFNLDVSVQKRDVACMVLVRISKDDKLRTKGGTPRTNSIRQTNDSMRYLVNKPFNSLVSLLGYFAKFYHWNDPIVDGSGYKGNIDIALSKKFVDNMDLQGLKTELNNYGLDLVEKSWPWFVLVVKERQTINRE